MLQIARQLTDGIDGILLDKRYIILDRDTRKLAPLFHLVDRAVGERTISRSCCLRIVFLIAISRSRTMAISLTPVIRIEVDSCWLLEVLSILSRAAAGRRLEIGWKSSIACLERLRPRLRFRS